MLFHEVLQMINLLEQANNVLNKEALQIHTNLAEPQYKSYAKDCLALLRKSEELSQQQQKLINEYRNFLYTVK